MKKYDDFSQNESIQWTNYKIVVPTDEDKQELMETFKHFHDSDIDTEFVCVNQLAHEYLDGDNIIVSSTLFNSLNKVNLTPLDVWNSQELFHPLGDLPQPNGLSCPNCGLELQDDKTREIILNPSEKSVSCTGCGFQGFRRC